MKLRLALLGVSSTLILAVPAHAEPDGEAPTEIDSGAFLASLQAAGFTYTSTDQVIAAGKTVCDLANRGEPGLELITDLKANNPGLSTDRAAQFAAIAARTYCPHHLTPKSK